MRAPQVEATGHAHHEGHAPLPTSGSALNGVAFSATLHCLTGCAIGEVLGMIIGTATGLSDLQTILLAVALAFLFGYTLTSLPLLRAGMAVGAVVPIALATDTFSIAVMEIVDNGIMLVIPGAMEAGVGDVLFWGALSVALVIAGVVAFPVNRWLITRGKGHAVLHETGIHGGPPTRLVAFIAAAAAVFGTSVLIGEAVGDDAGATHGGAPAETRDSHGTDAGAGHADEDAPADPVRGLAVAANGLELELDRTQLPRGRPTELRFRVLDSGGRPVRDFQVEHERRMHLILVRRDMTAFQHLHPRLAGDGTWSVTATLPEAGSYRVFADFKRGDRNQTLAGDLAVDGPLDTRPPPAIRPSAAAGEGYRVELGRHPARAGAETELGFTVTRRGRRVAVDDYLGAKGHLVALREGDLAYLHVHPSPGDHGDAVRFMTEFPSAGRYALYLQFKHDDKVRTAAFTRAVAR